MAEVHYRARGKSICPCAGNDDDLCALIHPNSGLLGPLETVYLGVCVAIQRDQHVVLARLRNTRPNKRGTAAANIPIS
jgi:hypothetical protein